MSGHRPFVCGTWEESQTKTQATRIFEEEGPGFIIIL